MIAIGNAVLISVLLVAQIWMKPLGQFRAVDHLRTSLLLLPVFASGIFPCVVVVAAVMEGRSSCIGATFAQSNWLC